MNQSPMTVGVIGTGMICRIYIENIVQRFKIVELKAAADIAVEKAREVSDQFGVRTCHQIQRIQYGTDRKRSAGRRGFLWKV